MRRAVPLRQLIFLLVNVSKVIIILWTSRWVMCFVRSHAAWLRVCRVTAIMALVAQLVCLVLFVVLVVCSVCRFISCPPVHDQLCQRVLLYATPITSLVAGKHCRLVDPPLLTYMTGDAAQALGLCYTMRTWYMGLSSDCLSVTIRCFIKTSYYTQAPLANPSNSKAYFP